MKNTRDLIEKCMKGDRNAQRVFYETNYQWLMSICFRYHSNTEDAASILNKGFLKMMSSLGQFDLDRPIEPWMKVIMVNTSLDALRKSSHYKSRFTLLDDKEWEQQHNSPGGIHALHENLEIEEYWELFKRLPEPEKTIFNMYAIDGYSHREIAEKMEISERTSKRYLKKARATLSDAVYELNRIEKGA